MTIFRQSDIPDSELRRIIGNNGTHLLSQGRSIYPTGVRRGVEVDEDGNTSSLTTLLEQSRERLGDVVSQNV